MLHFCLSAQHWQRFSDSLGRNAAPSPAKINHDSAVKRKAVSLFTSILTIDVINFFISSPVCDRGEIMLFCSDVVLVFFK